MKTLAVLCLSLIALGSQARASEGNADLVIYPDNQGGFYETNIRQEGNTILGSSMGASVDLLVHEGIYQGPTGPGLTSLACTNGKCTGFINSASFDMTTGENGFTGNISAGTLGLVRKNGEILITGARASSMDLKQTSAGNYEGTGVFANGVTFSATLKTSGTLADLRDPALAAIFLVAPFSRY